METTDGPIPIDYKPISKTDQYSSTIPDYGVGGVHNTIIMT